VVVPFGAGATKATCADAGLQPGYSKPKPGSGASWTTAKLGELKTVLTRHTTANVTPTCDAEPNELVA